MGSRAESLVKGESALSPWEPLTDTVRGWPGNGGGRQTTVSPVLFLEEARTNSQVLELLLKHHFLARAICLRGVAVDGPGLFRALLCNIVTKAQGHVGPCYVTLLPRQQEKDTFPDVLNLGPPSSMYVFPTCSHMIITHYFIFPRQGFMNAKLALNWLYIQARP